MSTLHDAGRLDMRTRLLPKGSVHAQAFTIDFECTGISVPSSLDEIEVRAASRRGFSSDKHKFRTWPTSSESGLMPPSSTLSAGIPAGIDRVDVFVAGERMYSIDLF